MQSNTHLAAACFSALLASTGLQAASFNEEDWKRTISYSNITVAEDSVQEWGPWSAFVEPAAGGPVFGGLGYPGGGGGSFYRNQPAVAVNTPGGTPALAEACPNVDACGFALFNNLQQVGKQQGEASAYQLGDIVLDINGPSTGAGVGTVGWTLAAQGGPTPNYNSSGAPVDVEFEKNFSSFLPSLVVGGQAYDYPSIAALRGLAPYLFNPGSFLTAIQGGTISIDGVTHTVPAAADPVAIGLFGREVAAYVNGSPDLTTRNTAGYYIAGVPTTLAQLNGVTNQVNAVYVGGSFDGVSQGSVRLAVNFNASTWTGSWRDNGSFNFDATGTLSGATLSGSAQGAGFTGNVQGKVYGTAAQTIAGSSSVTNAANQTQKALFLTNKVN